MAKLEDMAEKLGIKTETETEIKAPSVVGKYNNDYTPTKRRAWLQAIESGSISEINPDEIVRWKFKDRPENELGDIEGLAKDIEANGQIQPVVLRKITDNQFELIVGERRWRACKYLEIKVKAVVRELDDQTAAIVQVSENLQRKDLSDYAKAKSYSQMISAGLFKQTDLAKKIGKSQSYIRNMLSFFKIRDEVLKGIGDLRGLSSRTAYAINCIQDKGNEYLFALQKIAPKIISEKMGELALNRAVNQIVSGSATLINEKEVLSTVDGTSLFVLKSDMVGVKGIKVSRCVRGLLDINKIEEALRSEIETQMKNIKEKNN